MDNPTPPNELALPISSIQLMREGLEIPPTPPSSAPSRRPSQSGPSQAQLPIEQAVINLIKPVEPPVTYLEIFKFIWWSITVVVTQLWGDLKSGKFYKPLLSTDFATHYFVGKLNPWLTRCSDNS
jgi:hypothetical protein